MPCPSINAMPYGLVLVVLVVVYTSNSSAFSSISSNSIILRWGRFSLWGGHTPCPVETPRQPPRSGFFVHLMLGRYGRSEKNAPLAFQLNNVPRSTSWSPFLWPSVPFLACGISHPKKVHTNQVRPQVLLLSVFILIHNYLVHRHRVIAQRKP